MTPTTKPAVGSEDLPMPDAARGREERTLSIAGLEWRESVASGDKTLQMRGHASVFDRMSLDLGGFREKIAPGAFTRALDKNPDVHLLWDHDTSRILASTASKRYRLDLAQDEHGLAFRADIAPTSYAADLRVLMESDVISQASFAFTVERDEWLIDDEDTVTRTILEVGELYDVTVTARGAYPQASSAVVEHMRSLIRANTEIGEPAEAAPAPVTPEIPAGESESRDDAGSDEQRNVTPETAGGESSPEGGEETRDLKSELKRIQAQARMDTQLAKQRLMAAQRTGD
jgi:uncharacterized protein